MDKPVQVHIEGVADDVWNMLAVATRREMLAGMYAALDWNAPRIGDAGCKWLKGKFPNFHFSARTVGEHTVLEIRTLQFWDTPKNMVSGGDIILELSEKTLEFISPKLFTQISLVCG